MDKIIGIGKHSLVDYILSNDIYLPRMKYAAHVWKWSYVTTVAGILIYYGVAGFFSFIAFIVGQLKKENFAVKKFVLILAAVGLHS